MMRAQADQVPPFWTEPWRWAEPAWRRRYGAPLRDFDRCAARLIYGGWVACFDLPRQWCPPADPRWLRVVQVSPAVLRGVASVLGYIALLRGGVSVALACRSPIDPWLALALQFREVNCMRSKCVATQLDLSASYACGVGVLRAMARRDWPDVDSRIAMLLAPNAPNRLPDADRDDNPMQAMEDQALALEWIDVGRCLSLCCAVTRHAAAQSVSWGAP